MANLLSAHRSVYPWHLTLRLSGLKTGPQVARDRGNLCQLVLSRPSFTRLKVTETTERIDKQTDGRTDMQMDRLSAITVDMQAGCRRTHCKLIIPTLVVTPPYDWPLLHLFSASRCSTKHPVVLRMD